MCVCVSQISELLIGQPGQLLASHWSPIWLPIGLEQAASFPASGIAQTTHTVIREELLLKTDSGVCGGLRLTIVAPTRRTAAIENGAPNSFD